MFKGQVKKDQNDKRKRRINGLVVIGITVVLILAASAGSIFVIRNSLDHAVGAALVAAVDKHSVPDADTGVPQLVSVPVMQQDFIKNLQGELKNWPQVSYTLQSFQAFSEKDKGSQPPTGFTTPIPGPSVYVTMSMKISHWKIPIHSMVICKSYETSTGTWVQ